MSSSDLTEKTEGTTLLGSILHSWDRFWFTPMDPLQISFIRLCAGWLVFYVLLTYSWGLFSYVGPNGWVDHELAMFIIRDVEIYALPFDWSNDWVKIDNGNYYWSIYYHLTNTNWIIAVHVFFLLASLAFALGLWTRYTSILTWIAAISYVHRSSTTVFGLDTMMMIVLLYLMLSPCGARLSLDHWLQKRAARRKGLPEPLVEPSISTNFAIRLIQVHFCIIYLAGGTSKLLGTSWWSGTALNLVMANPAFAPMDNEFYYQTLKFLAAHRVLWETAMTAGIVFTLVLEISFFYLVWDMRWRWVMICGSVLLHLGIGLFMGLVTFSLMMMIMVSSFIPPEVIRGLVTRVEQTLGILSSSTTQTTTKQGELVLTP